MMRVLAVVVAVQAIAISAGLARTSYSPAESDRSPSSGGQLLAGDDDPEGMTPPPPPLPRDDRLRLPARPGNDYSFIQGCWRTDPFRHRPSQALPGISTYCFDANGVGRLDWRVGTTTCSMRAQARFEGTVLRLRDTDTTCNDGTHWFADFLTCQGTSEGAAACSGISYLPNGSVLSTWTVGLHALRQR